MTNQILRLAKVMELTGLARSTVYHKIAKGYFPPPIKLSKRASHWIETEVNDWIKEQIHRSRPRDSEGTLDRSQTGGIAFSWLVDFVLVLILVGGYLSWSWVRNFGSVPSIT